MAKKPTPLAGESQTTNYGWVKPTVGSSVDLWGGYINTDLDGIDSIVHGIDARIIGDNRIINGDMRIDQRNNGASGSASGYTVDRWTYGPSQSAKGTWQRAGPVALGTSAGFQYALSFTSSSAFAVAATDYFQFNQTIEADQISDFQWGTANAQPVTLSFWAFSSLTGTFGGCLKNYAGTRGYPFNFSLPTASTWTKIVVTIPGDTAGAWVMSGNGAALVVVFDLGAGANWRAPVGAWAAGNLVGATGAVSVVGTNAATFYVTGVKLEIGSTATPYNQQSLAKSMADCQRYYFNMAQLIQLAGNSGGANFTSYANALFPVRMRAAPTAVPTFANGVNETTPRQIESISTDGFIVRNTAVAAGGFSTQLMNCTFSAEL